MIRIALAGDVVPMRTGAATDPDATAAIGILKSADLAIGSLDMALTKHTAPLDKHVVRRADPAVAADVAQMGFHVLSVANNHAVDFGWSGLDETMHAVCAAGMDPVGAGDDEEMAWRGLVRNVGGQRIGLLAFSCLNPPGSAARAFRPGTAHLPVAVHYAIDQLHAMEEPGDPAALHIATTIGQAEMAALCARVRRIASACDFLIASVHWGYGSGGVLADYQRPLAHALIESGAGMIHGHHPHGVYGFEIHRGAPIFYSMGTFLAQQLLEDAGPRARAIRAGMSRAGLLAVVDIADRRVRAGTIHHTTLGASHTPLLTGQEPLILDAPGEPTED